jgi:hypothetical protein
MTTALAEKQLDTIPSRPPTAPKGISTQEVVELSSKGLSDRQIATLLNCSKTTVNHHLRNHRTDIKGLKYFKQNKADILALYQKKLLYSITTDDIKKMPAGTKITGAAILFDKERLLRGESTENIAVRSELEDKSAECKQSISDLLAKLPEAEREKILAGMDQNSEG